MTRKVFYDCEFLEDGSTIDLISIGMVDDGGRELYLVNASADWARVARDPWLMDNVVSSLPLTDNPVRYVHSAARIDLGHPAVLPKAEIADRVREYLICGTRPDELELWAWYGAYDHVALAQLWGRMVDLPAGVPMWTNDLRQEMHRLGDPPGGPVQQRGEHNALEDARHLKARYDWLMGGA